MVNTFQVDYDQLISTEKVIDMPQIDGWITVREAQPLLKVTTTQGVWSIIVRAERRHGVTVQKRNMGTDKAPRYLLSKVDVENVARAMGKL